MSIVKPIILTEFPKSGGSWIVSLLSDALKLPARDIYVRPGFDLFEIRKHPWYKHVTDFDFPLQSVIKSHELPASDLINFDATYIHLVRDGRDVVVSKWFFDTEFCVKNGISNNPKIDFDKYVENTSRQWANYVYTWINKSEILIRYEDFLTDPVLNMESLLWKLGVNQISHDALEHTVSKFTKDKFKASLNHAFKHNTFVRKGIAGDWKNNFSKTNIEAFKIGAGETLRLLGYEENPDW